MRTLTTFLLCLLFAVPVCAQRIKRDPLTAAEKDQIEEAGVAPVDRLDLYVKITNEHADTIQGLIKRAHSAARAHRIDDELQDFAALTDELSSNLDVYADRKADIRKSMKGMNESVARWLSILNSLPSEPGFEVSRQDAIDSSSDLATQAKQVTADQDAYFKAHPDEKGQDRAEPKGSQ
jgi:methyl-accepting chemotaxis protein